MTQQLHKGLQFVTVKKNYVLALYNIKLGGKYSLGSTDPRESEIRAPPQLTIALKLSYYLFIVAELFKVKDGCLKFVYIGKISGLRRFWTVTSTPG